MKLPRRRFLRLAAGIAALPAVSRNARAQTYPAHAITMVVPFPAGGATTVLARVLAEEYDISGRFMKVRGLPGAIARLRRTLAAS